MREVRRVDSGPLRVGSEAVVKQPGLPRARWRVTELTPDRSFTWETTAGGVTTAGGHVVDASEQGSTITLTLRLRGPLARPVGVLTSRRAQRSLMMEMEGFRRTAEGS